MYMYNILHLYPVNLFIVGAATLLIALMPNAQCDAAHLRLSGAKPNPDMIYDEKLWNPPPPPPPTKTIDISKRYIWEQKCFGLFSL